MERGPPAGSSVVSLTSQSIAYYRYISIHRLLSVERMDLFIIYYSLKVTIRDGLLLWRQPWVAGRIWRLWGRCT